MLQNPSNLTDAELVEAIRAGEVRALRLLMERHAPVMLRLASVVSGSPESAQDVVQEVFMNLWSQGRDLSIRGDVRGYLWNAVRNRARNVVRHEGAVARLHNTIAADEAGLRRTVENAAPHLIEAQERAAAVYRGIAALPPRCQEMFLLRWRDGLTNDEVADALEIDVSNVRKQVARAVDHLAAYLKAQGLT